MEESAYYLPIVLAFVGFVAFAFVLLFPIWRFIRKQEQQSQLWTPEALAERQRRAIEAAERAAASGDGSAQDPPSGPGAHGDPPELRA